MTTLITPSLSRRNFCRGLVGAAGVCALPNTVLADVLTKGANNVHLQLALQSIHTGEKGKFDIVVNGAFVEEELYGANKILRDWRTDDMHDMDRATLMQMVNIAKLLGKQDHHFHIISGYRSPKTNAKLASKSGGVAKKSLHMQGKAIDIAMPGVSIDHLHKAALSLQAGGVGKYSGSGFVHVDSGRVRSWGA